jgi:hypothetical protein
MYAEAKPLNACTPTSDNDRNSWMATSPPTDIVKVVTITTVPPMTASAPTPRLILAIRRSVSVL